MGQRILRITGQLFVDMLGPGKRSYEVVENALPADTRIVNGTLDFPYSFSSEIIVLKLESAEWPELMQGERIPEIRPKLRRADG